MNNKHLYILWTSGDKVTAEKMVFMYAINSLIHKWWDKVTLIVWGASTQLVSEDKEIQERIQDALAVGVHVTACKGCSDELGVSETMIKLGVEVVYWGDPLTKLLKNNEKLITV